MERQGVAGSEQLCSSTAPIWYTISFGVLLLLLLLFTEGIKSYLNPQAFTSFSQFSFPSHSGAGEAVGEKWGVGV